MSLYNRILVPISDSILSSKVLINAVRFAKEQNADLIILNVEEPVVGAFSTAIRYSQESLAVTKNKVINEAMEKLANCGLNVTYKIVAGNAAECILDVAERTRCNLIIIGSHGFGMSDLLFTNTATIVAGKADIPVLVIK